MMCKLDIIEEMKNIPEKSSNESLIEYTERLTDWYLDRTSPDYRKKRGQFFTPGPISSFMVMQYQDIYKKNEIRILDTGAGVGILESAFCEYLLSLGKKINVFFTLYENDENLFLLLKKNMSICKRIMADTDSHISYRIINEDFILSSTLNYNNNDGNSEINYDLILSNPPYYKLNGHNSYITETKNILKRHPNIYSLFMTLSAMQLNNEGQMVIITPRSYCSGLYFKEFRKWFFSIMKPLKIHVFNSRSDVFKKYDVLQENLILTAKKSLTNPEKVSVTVSDGIFKKDETLKVINTTYDFLFIKRNDDIILRIPTSEMGKSIALQLDNYNNTFSTLGFNVSTGPVVPFRTIKNLVNSKKYGENYVPLIWMHNINNGKVILTNSKSNKPSYILRTPETEKLLLNNGNYVLIKRFSTKEGKKRICSGVFLERFLYAEKIGIENHVNYVYKNNNNMTEDEALGITAILNSDLYNEYFQMENGSTQVNANDLKNIPLPPIEKIRKIGKLIIENENYKEFKSENIVEKELKYI